VDRTKCPRGLYVANGPRIGDPRFSPLLKLKQYTAVIGFYKTNVT